MTDAPRFGNYAALTSIKHTFEKSPELYTQFRSPTAKDELKVAQYVSTQIQMPGSTPPYRYPNTIEVMFFEVATLYDGSNIAGAPIPTSETASIYAFINEMPLEMVREMWKAMSASIPGWGPEKKAVTSKS